MATIVLQLGDLAQMKLDQMAAMAKGMMTCLPFAYSTFQHKRVCPDAGYFYGIWLRHLMLLNEAANLGVPRVVAELGPGDSLGTGVAALLSGADRYIGIDARPLAGVEANEKITDDLVGMFVNRVPVNPSGWSDATATEGPSFPSMILSDENLQLSLAPQRVRRIRDEVRNVLLNAPGAMISYRAPLTDPRLIPDGSIDLLLSHSVLEHVVDLRAVLRNAFRWLKPGGYTSHQFDLSSHNIVKEWDGHRAFSNIAWNVVAGARPFLINRLSYAAIVGCFVEAGFQVVMDKRGKKDPTLSRQEMCDAWRLLPPEEIETFNGFVIARKPLASAAV